MPNRRQFLTKSRLAIASFCFASPLLFASSAFAAKDAIYNHRNIAIDGTDPVSYFTQGRPVPGHKSFSFVYEGAEFRFSSATNRDLFAANPEKYAPQYGGYCAYAVSHGYTASTIPQAFTIVEGKLYLNYSLSVRDLWEASHKVHIDRANQNWPDVLK